MKIQTATPAHNISTNIKVSIDPLGIRDRFNVLTKGTANISIIDTDHTTDVSDRVSYIQDLFLYIKTRESLYCIDIPSMLYYTCGYTTLFALSKVAEGVVEHYHIEYYNGDNTFYYTLVPMGKGIIHLILREESLSIENMYIATTHIRIDLGIQHNSLN